MPGAPRQAERHSGFGVHGAGLFGSRQIGERVSVIPNHACVVTNLFNQIVGVRQTAVEVIWPVAARGAFV